MRRIYYLWRDPWRGHTRRRESKDALLRRRDGEDERRYLLRRISTHTYVQPAAFGCNVDRWTPYLGVPGERDHTTGSVRQDSFEMAHVVWFEDAA